MATAVSSSYNDIHLETIQEIPSASCSTSCSSNSTSCSSNSPSPSMRNSNRNLHKKGQKIGNYILGKTIGSGTSSKVKIGTHIHTGKQYAIKITKPKRIKERKEIEREISILKRLKHDNIIQLHDAIYDDEAGKICLILELVSGGELFDYIVARGRLSEKEGRKFFRQMLCGLIYCHSNMVCHRDLKLENLLVDDEGNVKISDFGYSNIVRPGNLLSTFCGSPVYAPPEILLEKRYNGTEVDIWSMGVILYAMVTGQLPWTLTDGVQVEGMDRLLRGEFKYPSHVILSDDVKELINRMIVAEPSERATLDEIKSHIWVNKGFSMEPDQEYNKKISDRLEKEQQQALLQQHEGTKSPRQPCSESPYMNGANKPSLFQSSPNLTLPTKLTSHNSNNNIIQTNNDKYLSPNKPSQFSSAICLDEKKINSTPSSPHSISPQYTSPQLTSPTPSASTTPPLSPLSVSGQRSPPTTPNFKTSLFHNIFKKKQSNLHINQNHNNSNSHSDISVSVNNSPTINGGQQSIVDNASANAPISKRRFSLEDIVKVITRNKNKNPKIRTMRGPFTSGTTTRKTPLELFSLIEENLNSNNIVFRKNCYVFDCKHIGTLNNETINFEIEICRVSGMDMYGIKFKRLYGDAWCYSSLCKQIVNGLTL
ncbi:hypothetical protein DICPUDRAFT_157371 [Dictyostelium purpureum]|uniref:non-specific serine/threonine protein kinase n=1 Tax=Dictyostelium purpureum TaxID=5786 RepID=F0ZYY9_DICPU|nr:uncharacterized protein DICPUDRAFT_157371 [Dictyostelium purpureum]EGC30845.1 hypothetical protein DICPUDRAFT_157371 [Dictyostelium purpureum]|eukprot:XP_003292634.1 hypothetical protein DICPUDRAFT_157371 [Dictyostelium purpureum]